MNLPAPLYCLILALLAPTCAVGADPGPPCRTIPAGEYRDKMKAGWIGQIAGVSWGAPTEFKCRDKIMPESAMPAVEARHDQRRLRPGRSLRRDDLPAHAGAVRPRRARSARPGIDFANSGYPLWCANDAGRKNLRKRHRPARLQPSEVQHAAPTTSTTRSRPTSRA